MPDERSHISREMLNKYEAAEIISARAMLLSNGATMLLSDAERPSIHDPIQIAAMELRMGRIDAEIVRGEEHLKVSELKLPDMVFHITKSFPRK